MIAVKSERAHQALKVYSVKWSSRHRRWNGLFALLHKAHPADSGEMAMISQSSGASRIEMPQGQAHAVQCGSQYTGQSCASVMHLP